jgi:arsenical pump membrane protein
MIFSAGPSQIAIWVIAALSVIAIIVRPFRWPEAVWAMVGAVILVVFRLLPPTAAWNGVLKGLDVYLFLTGMMALAEVARQEGLFDWLAFLAVRHAKGSPRRLFALIYAVGIGVTTFLSNDATAVVLTPAVYAAAKAANADPLPYLFICAFIANAASFVLPISNPANLVVYAGHMPALGAWLARFGLASLLSIAATFWLLRWTQSRALRSPIAEDAGSTPLSTGGKIAALGICATAVALIGASAFDWQLGGPAFIAGLLTVTAVLIVKREGPWTIMKDISWSVLPLVAGLFVLVEALERSGLLVLLVNTFKQAAAKSEVSTGWAAGLILAAASNVVNNLPAGLLAGAVVQGAALPGKTAGAILIGVDLGPNLSVTGSLATILWLTAIRRDGENASAWTFFKLGMIIMPPALFVALAAVFLSP